MYKIGQVLWLISKTSNSIAPVQVVSKTTTEDIDGFATAHTIKTVEGQTACLEDTTADITVFETPVAAEKHLIENATRFIRSLSMQANEKASRFTAHKPDPAVVTPESDSTTAALRKDDPNITQIILENGTKANVNMKVPEGFQA